MYIDGYLCEILKVFCGHKELLDSGVCDVVVVSTPNMTHYEILMDIISHHKPHHVLVEKPLCTTIAHCRQVSFLVPQCCACLWLFRVQVRSKKLNVGSMK